MHSGNWNNFQKVTELTSDWAKIPPQVSLTLISVSVPPFNLSVFKCSFIECASQLPVTRNSYGKSSKNWGLFWLMASCFSPFAFGSGMVRSIMVRACDRRSCSHHNIQEMGRLLISPPRAHSQWSNFLPIACLLQVSSSPNAMDWKLSLEHMDMWETFIIYIMAQNEYKERINTEDHVGELGSYTSGFYNLHTELYKCEPFPDLLSGS